MHEPGNLYVLLNFLLFSVDAIVCEIIKPRIIKLPSHWNHKFPRLERLSNNNNKSNNNAAQSQGVNVQQNSLFWTHGTQTNDDDV